MIRAGKPWGQHGITQAFNRVIEGAGLSGWTVYALRHYAITLWLRAGIPVHVVQRMAGHTNLRRRSGMCTISRRISRRLHERLVTYW
jgi:integrase